MQYSLLSVLAISRISAGASSLNVTWVMPDLSLRSTKTRLPRLLALATQPFSTTDLPSSASLSSPHICVLLNNICETFLSDLSLL